MGVEEVVAGSWPQSSFANLPTPPQVPPRDSEVAGARGSPNLKRQDSEPVTGHNLPNWLPPVPLELEVAWVASGLHLAFQVLSRTMGSSPGYFSADPP